MRTWRQIRREHPDLLNKGVKVWGQKEATMDEMICGLLTDTDAEDAEKHKATQTMVQVDLCGGEHTQFSREVKFLHNQPQTTIGNKQTARLQVTDIRYARCGKVRQNQIKPKIRSALRGALP